MSPSASAPRMASTSACRPTSPSEWARKPRRVRHADAADHQMIAVAEGVHVVAGAGPDVAEHGAEAGFFADEIFGRGQFHVRRIAFKGRHRQSRPFGQRRIVGEIAAAVARGAAMGVEDDVETKRLRRLRDPQPRAVRRRFDIAAVADLLDRVGDGDRRNRGAGTAGGVDRARNHRRGHEGPRGVVDQNDVGLLARQRLEPGMHRGLTRRAAIGRWLMAQAGDGLVEDGGVVGIHHRLHGEHVRMAAERLHGAEDHGLAADGAVLLRARRRRREGRARLRRGWRLCAQVSALDSITGRIWVEERVRSLAHSPYHAECAKTERFPIAVGKAVFVAVHLHK